MQPSPHQNGAEVEYGITGRSGRIRNLYANLYAVTILVPQLSAMLVYIPSFHQKY